MIPPQASAVEKMQEENLLRRDWVLIPTLCLLTICLMAACTELIARRIFSESKSNNENCLVLNDPTTGVRGIPNSACWEKVPEGQWVEYRFDRCGYRSDTPCGPKAPGTYRIVMAGSSTTLGERVPVELTLAALLPRDLSQRTGRKVDLYNEGMAYGFPRATALRFHEVLAQKPDLVLWVLTPQDIGEGEFVYAESAAEKTHRASRIWTKLKDALASNSLMDHVRAHVDGTRTALMLRYLIYENENPDQYIESYLRGPDTATGFLKMEMSPLWKSNLEEFDRYAADIEERARAAGVPFAAVFLPNRAQAAMISLDQWPAGYDPYKLNNEVRAIIVNHSGTFIDVLKYFRNVPNPEQYYLPVDGHPTAGAHAIFARLVSDGLTSGSVPELKASAQNQIAMVKSR